jgi:hypothetical protein
MKNSIFGLVAAILALITLFVLSALCFICYLHYLTAPSVHRLPFPASEPFTEAAAVQLSRQALILDGKGSKGMHPVPYWHHDDSVFVRNDLDPNKGCILWWLQLPDHAWEYKVDLTRRGDEVECAISKPL